MYLLRRGFGGWERSLHSKILKMCNKGNTATNLPFAPEFVHQEIANSDTDDFRSVGILVLFNEFLDALQVFIRNAYRDYSHSAPVRCTLHGIMKQCLIQVRIRIILGRGEVSRLEYNLAELATAFQKLVCLPCLR